MNPSLAQKKKAANQVASSACHSFRVVSHYLLKRLLYRMVVRIDVHQVDNDMIGNAYPYRDTGYSILEQGDIDAQTLQLKIKNYIVVDPRGNEITEVADILEAEKLIDSLLKEGKG